MRFYPQAMHPWMRARILGYYHEIEQFHAQALRDIEASVDCFDLVRAEAKLSASKILCREDLLAEVEHMTYVFSHMPQEKTEAKKKTSFLCGAIGR